MTICLLYQRLHLKDLLFSLEEQSATELKIIHGGEFEKSIIHIHAKQGLHRQWTFIAYQRVRSRWCIVVFCATENI